MTDFILSPVLLGIQLPGVPFEASGESDALLFGRAFVAGRCDARPRSEIGRCWRIDRLVYQEGSQLIDDTTFVAECRVVKRGGQTGAIWAVPAPPPEASRH